MPSAWPTARGPSASMAWTRRSGQGRSWSVSLAMAGWPCIVRAGFHPRRPQASLPIPTEIGQQGALIPQGRVVAEECLVVGHKRYTLTVDCEVDAIRLHHLWPDLQPAPLPCTQASGHPALGTQAWL